VGLPIIGHTVAGSVGFTAANSFIGDISDIIIGLTGSSIPTEANMATIHAALAAGTLATAALDTIFGAGLWAWWAFGS